ncbi:MAG: putative coiled-coil protein SlyX [Cryomorphaceae bacterium]|jgi:uncharacterized coiled-coil protein SlyX
MTNSLEKLEVKVAFLEEALSQLGDEFYRQQKELNALKSNFELVKDKLGSGGDGESGLGEVLDERPPHY